MIDLILAAPDVPGEPDLVACAALNGIRVTRRSLDAADLLAAAAADPRMAVAVSLGVPRLSGDLVGRLTMDQRTFIGVAVSDADEDQLRAWGVTRIVRHGGDAVATMRAIALLVQPSAGGVWPTQCEVPDARALSAAPMRSFIAVWGPTGAPGRTTTALSIAEALARGGVRVCLVDADTYSPSVNAQLGVCEDTSGLVIACRQADNATLNTRTLLAATRQFAENLFVLGGLPRADRWPDLRESALRSVWHQARVDFDVVIVDVGSCVEHEGTVMNPAGSLLLASRRNAAATTSIEVADQVVVTARHSTIGVTRLLNELPPLIRVNDRARRVIVLTGPRRIDGDVGGAKRLLLQVGISDPVGKLARDDGRLEQAVRRGMTPYESATGRERSAINAIAVFIRERAAPQPDRRPS